MLFLGEMLEIGSYTEEGHRLVGQKVAASGIDYLVAVGKKAHDFIVGAEEANFASKNIFYFSKSEEAAEFLSTRVGEGDVLLIKGSQGARMEKVVKTLMAEPERAVELIVRQGKEWEGR